ncbi:type II secretion system F family protein [Dietzia massiliensis]|uniref:type II secretion system F family protein n=1 Tax=Dietzia massiliensis TaxID=2697499 RepID=UPI001BCB00A0|nr:type II secretion system F family protein [Dietzia massiliensis]MBS7548670.1 type II secretion system F family protein [Dietzia massiliensis]
MSPAVLLLAAAVCIAPWRPRAAERLDAVLPDTAGPARQHGATGLPHSVATSAAAALTGRIAGPVVRLVVPLTRRRHASADTEVLAHLLDLLAVALLAGLPTPDALSAVADAVEHSDPDAAEPLRAAAARMRLGATSAEAWRDVPGAARLAPVAPVLIRAGDGGGSVRSALEHAAARMRSEADAAATARAERASVLVAGPLGLCFLPAFVCLGVLPVVVGLADGMLPGVMP